MEKKDEKTDKEKESYIHATCKLEEEK